MKKIVYLSLLFLSSSCFADYKDRFFETPIEQLESKCNTGDAESCYYSGLRSNNAEKAVHYYLKACYGDYGRGCYRAFEKIIEVENPERKVHKLKLLTSKLIEPLKYGCSIGDAKTCRYLGSIYATEEFGTVNYEVAKKHLTKGCLYGDNPSCELLEKLKILGY